MALPLWRGCCVLEGAAAHPCHVLWHFAALARRQRLPLLPQEFQVFHYALLHLHAFFVKVHFIATGIARRQ
jgi:hypothetical protein